MLLQNVAANHRANDVIVKEGAPQILIARFMYGPIDVIALTGMSNIMCIRASITYMFFK